MHSPDNDARAAQADRSRRVAEFALRLFALGALLVALVRAGGFWPRSDANSSGASMVLSQAGATDDTRMLVTELRNALTAGVKSVHVAASTVPGDPARALLSAVRQNGIAVSWTDSMRNSDIAVEANALVDPRGGVSIRVAAPGGTRIAIRDTVGLLDTLTSRVGGASLVSGRVAGTVWADGGGNRAHVPAPRAPVLRRVLLLARPGWEAKFTMAALEERGWSVDAQFAVAPKVVVTQGSPASPDTARYAAIVALDSAAQSSAARVVRYAQSGGGVVIVGEAASLGELQPILAGTIGRRSAGVPGALATATPRAALGLWPVIPRRDAVVLERSVRGETSHPAVVARRVVSGRVVQVGYDGLWEWRMQGGPTSVAAHRDWWGRLLASVAFAPSDESSNGSGSRADEFRAFPGATAPRADLVARLGPPTSMPAGARVSNARRPWEPWLLIVAALALVAEWGSRRLRGAR